MTRLADTRFKPTPPHLMLDVGVRKCNINRSPNHVPHKDDLGSSRPPELHQTVLPSLTVHRTVIAKAPDAVARKHLLAQVQH